jgi:hypothetical protein
MVMPLSGFAGERTRDASQACSDNNFDEVRLQPGCATICYEQPCKVYFRMPAGRGLYRVRGRGVVIGDYPAGRTVLLGDFWQGNHVLHIEGANVAPAYLYVGNTFNN